MLKAEACVRAESKGQPFDVLTVASDNLSRDLVYFGGKRRVCFDSLADFALRSAPLAEAARNEDIVELEMTEDNDKDLKSLLEMLPEGVLNKMTDDMKTSLLDMNLTVGCEATVRLTTGQAEHLDVRVMRRDLEEVLWHAGPVRREGRAVLEGKLHRIGVMCNHEGKPYSLTIRAGRHVKGVAQPILDVLRGMHDKCVLIIGPPNRLDIRFYIKFSVLGVTLIYCVSPRANDCDVCVVFSSMICCVLHRANDCDVCVVFKQL
jgi:hypothetical protein